MTATNALELGIDIGGLDVVLMLGYPSSTASFYQEVGRAGRAGRDGLAILVCFDAPLEQYFCRNPTALFDKEVEELAIDVNNVEVVKLHMLCAAEEAPLLISTGDDDNLQGEALSDILLFGANARKCLELLSEQHLLQPVTNHASYWQLPPGHDGREVYRIDVRNIEQDLVRVLIEPDMTEIDSIIYSEVRLSMMINVRRRL